MVSKRSTLVTFIAKRRKNIFSKTWLRAQYETFKYEISMRRKTNEEISAIVDHEKGLRAWCSQRSYYLAALKKECNRRGLAYIH